MMVATFSSDAATAKAGVESAAMRDTVLETVTLRVPMELRTFGVPAYFMPDPLPTMPPLPGATNDPGANVPSRFHSPISCFPNHTFLRSFQTQASVLPLLRFCSVTLICSTAPPMSHGMLEELNALPFVTRRRRGRTSAGAAGGPWTTQDRRHRARLRRGRIRGRVRRRR